MQYNNINKNNNNFPNFSNNNNKHQEKGNADHEKYAPPKNCYGHSCI